MRASTAGVSEGRAGFGGVVGIAQKVGVFVEEEQGGDIDGAEGEEAEVRRP